MCGCKNNSGFGGSTMLGVDYPELRSQSGFFGWFGSGDKVDRDEARQIDAAAAAKGMGLTQYSDYLMSIGDTAGAARVDLLYKQNEESVENREKTQEIAGTVLATGLGVIQTLQANKATNTTYTPPAEEPDNTKYWLMGVAGFMVVLIIIAVVVKMRKK